MKIRTLVSFSMILIGLTCQAQYSNHMILKKGFKDHIHFLTGDEIDLKRNGNTLTEEGIIQAIGEDFIYLNDEIIKISEIEEIIKHRNSFNFQAGGSTVQIAAPAYLLLAAVNGLIQNIRPIWGLSHILTSAIIFTFGTAFKKLETRTFKIGKRYYLLIVPSDPANF